MIQQEEGFEIVEDDVVNITTSSLPGSIAAARAALANGWTRVTATLSGGDQNPAPDREDLEERIPLTLALFARAKQGEVRAYLHLRALAGDTSVIATYPIMATLLNVGAAFGGFHTRLGKLAAFRKVEEFHRDMGNTDNGPINQTPGAPVPGDPGAPVVGDPKPTKPTTPVTGPPNTPPPSNTVPQPQEVVPPTFTPANPVLEVLNGSKSFSEVGNGSKAIIVVGVLAVAYLLYRVTR